MIMLMVIMVSVMLAACNEEHNDVDENDANGDKHQEKEEKEETTNSDGEKTKVEDQLDLAIGDTGTFDTTIGIYEVTVESAELVGPELEGIETELDDFLLLDMSIKNIGEKPLSLEDVIVSLDVTKDLDKSGFHDSSEAFESVSTFSGKIESGETIGGQFIAQVYKSDIYYFRENPGTVAAGGSNQVIWNIPVEELK